MPPIHCCRHARSRLPIGHRAGQRTPGVCQRTTQSMQATTELYDGLEQGNVTRGPGNSRAAPEGAESNATNSPSNERGSLGGDCPICSVPPTELLSINGWDATHPEASEERSQVDNPYARMGGTQVSFSKILSGSASLSSVNDDPRLNLMRPGYRSPQFSSSEFYPRGPTLCRSGSAYLHRQDSAQRR